MILSVSVEVAAAADVGMTDRRETGRGRFGRLLIELVVENGFDRAIGQRADVDGAPGGCVQPCRADRAFQLEDAKTGPVS